MTTKAKHDIHGKPYNRTAMIDHLIVDCYICRGIKSDKFGNGYPNFDE